MSDQTSLPGRYLETITKNIEIEIKMEPEVHTENIKVEPDISFNEFNAFEVQRNVASEYDQNAFKTEDSSMAQSRYNTESETTYIEIGTMGNSTTDENDKVWDHFEKIGDDECASCKYCQKLFAYKSSLLNLYAHLRRVHTAVYNYHWQAVVEPTASTSKDYPSRESQEEDDSDHSESPRKQALAWDHFYKIENFFAICKHCKRKLSYKTTTGNLNAHMRRVHKPILMEYLRAHNEKSSALEQVLDVKTSKDYEPFDTCSKFGVIWKYFDKIGNEYAMCKDCFKELSCKSTTGNLSTHLKRTHPSLYLQYRSITDRDPNEYTAIALGEDIPIPSLLSEHFEKKGRYTAMCKYCSKKLPLSTKSSSLSKHLRLMHAEIYQNYKATKETGNTTSLPIDNVIVSDSGNDSEAEKEDERILFEVWKKKGGIWAHYVQGKNRCATCKYCQKSISYKGTTGNLTGHLRRAHKSLYMNKESEKTIKSTNNTPKTIDVNKTIDSIMNNEANEGTADLYKVNNEHVPPVQKDPVLYVTSDIAKNTKDQLTSDSGAVALKDKLHSSPTLLQANAESTTTSVKSEENIKNSRDAPGCDEQPDNNSELELSDSVNQKNISDDETFTKISRPNRSVPLYKVKKSNLLWKKYLERLGSRSYQCKLCEKVFTSRQEVHLIFHLKAKHPTLYKRYLREQFHGLRTKSLTLEALDKSKNENMAKEFLCQHFKRRDKVTAQCKYCPLFCNWTMRRLVAHVEKHHPPLYTQYRSIKKTGLYDEVDKGFVKLKKNAIPSVFDNIEYPLKQSSNMTEENDAAVAQETNIIENKATENDNTAGENKIECRACLKHFDVSVGLYDLFQPWFLPWNGMESTVAADMTKIAKVQISDTDAHSKFICYACCVQLRDACEFTATVKRSDQILRLRCVQTGVSPGGKWPKPIKLDTSVDTAVMDVDIKQEMVDTDYDNESMGGNDTSLPNPAIESVDIKLEPDEFLDENPSDNNGLRFSPQTVENSTRQLRDNVATQSRSASEKHHGKIIRRDYCLFCKKLVVAFAKHAAQMHANEAEMRPVLLCPKQSVERKKLVAVLRKKGNFLYKQKVEKDPERNRHEDGHVSCPDCLGIVRKKLLSEHMKISHGDKCPTERPVCPEDAELEAAGVDKRLLEEVFPTMRKNRISLVAKTDKLIQAFGADYINQHKHSRYVNVTSRKMRELAKVLIEMQKIDPSIRTFSDALQPKNYELLVEATKIMSGYNEKTEKFIRPTLALNICTSYRQCCHLALEEAAKSPIDRGAKIKGFKDSIRLLHTSWRWDIYKKAMFNMTERKMGEIDHVTMIPLAKTARLFMDYLVQKSRYLGPQLTSSEVPQEELYKEFTEVVMCRVILFNRRRATEIQSITLKTYDKVNSGRFYELYKNNSLIEQITMKKCKCVMIPGRKDQIFPVYFTPEIVKDISMLRSVREQYFGNVNNPHLFGIPNTDNYMKASKVLEKHGKIYDTANYKSVSSMRYRKHVGILNQIFSMSWIDVHDLLNLLQLKQDHRLPDDLEQAARLCKILTAKDDLECIGKAIDEIDLNMEEDVENLQDGELDAYEDSDNEMYLTDPLDIGVKEKKKRILERWTQEQKEVVISFFSEHIKKNRPPKLQECTLLKEKYPELLQNKNWIKIKAFVQNCYKTKRKKI